MLFRSQGFKIFGYLVHCQLSFTPTLHQRIPVSLHSLESHPLKERQTLKDKIRVTVVGGSACSKAGLTPDNLSWPEIAFQDSERFKLRKISIGGLTLVRSVEILFSMEHTNLLVLHFGTSIGWPSLVVQFQDRFGIKFSSEFGFHQPISDGKSSNWLFRIRKWAKLKIKNLIKYFFLLIGLYKPKVSIHEIRDQIDAVISLASAKSDQILWIQHRALQDSHTKIGRAHV